jgi:hypothetical protein
VQRTIFTCRHKVIKRTCGPKLPQNVFSSPNRPEKVLNGIPQIFGTPWKKDHRGLEKSMLTKYGVWHTWDDFSFLTRKKKKLIREYKKIRKIFTAKFSVKKIQKIFTANFIAKKIQKIFTAKFIAKKIRNFFTVKFFIKICAEHDFYLSSQSD